MAKRSHPLTQLTLWRVREFLREPEALFWVFAFPVLMAVALGLAFRERGPQPVVIAIQQAPGADVLAARLDSTGRVKATVEDSETAYQALRRGRVVLMLIPGDSVTFVYDSTREDAANGRLVVDDALQRISGRQDPRAIREHKITEKGSRYIDFLIPGLLGMNIMSTGMWSIGFAIVRTRSNRLLKRLLATPMRKSSFMLSQMSARLVFLGFEVATLLVFGYVAFGVGVRGSILALALILLLGASVFAGMGLLVASRARTIEGVSGLMNVVMMPMFILSGVFFSASRFPDVMQPFIRALPLTALNDALRAVMIDGGSLASQWSPLAILAAWGLVSFGVALKTFRWT